MDLMDDDFGDLYADVEAQATSAINSDSSDTDDEDDLNIVLNDDDCKPRNGDVYNQHRTNDDGNDAVAVPPELNSHYKYLRGNNNNNNNNNNKAAFPSRGGDCEDNIKGSHSVIVSQCGYGFSLPWYRTILDVNIDTFQEKPWRYHGVDITDYFNFGFDEDSWKEYCNSVEQFQQQTHMWTRIPVYESSKLNQACEVGSEHYKVFKEASIEDVTQVEASSVFGNGGKRPLKFPKGRAIEVEGSFFERQPSADVKRPRIQDSDVVIQITVQDSTEGSFGSGKEELGHMDSSVHETSKNGDLYVDQNRGFHRAGSASGDELSVGSLEGSLDVSSALRRCSQPRTASNLMSLDSDSHGNDQISDVDGYHHQKVNVCTSERIDEALKTGNDAKQGVGRNTCNSDPCIIESELSIGDQSHFSPTLSCFGSDSEASEDSVHGDPVKMHSQLDLGAELHESVTSDQKNSNCNGIETKLGHIKYNSRHRSPIQEGQKCRYGRPHSVAEQKLHPENDDDAFPMTDVEGDSKHYTRRKCPVRDEWKCHSRRSRNFAVQKGHNGTDNDASPMLNAERLYERDHSSRDCSRQNERWHDFGYHDEDDFLYYRETGLSCGYGRERFANYHVQAVNTKYSRGKDHWRLRDELGPYVRRKWNGRENFRKRSSRVEYENNVDRDWKHCGRRLSNSDMITPTYRESRRLVSKYTSVFHERNTAWGRKIDKLQFGKRTNYDGHLLDYKHEDGFVQEKYGRFVSDTNRERDSLDETYGRPLPLVGRQSYKTNGGRWHDTVPPRKNVYESRLTEKYGRHGRQHGRQTCDEEGRGSGWFGSYNDIDNTDDAIDYHYDQVHFGRRMNGWQAKALHLMKDEARHQDDQLYAEEASFSYEKTSMHERIHAKYESAHGGILINDTQLERRRYKMLKERRSANPLNRNTDVIYRGEHEQTILRCRDSVDLIVGEGKSSGRCSDGRSLVCNGRLEKMDLRFAKEQKTLNDFNESHRGKAIQTDIPINESNENDDKWLDKFPVTEHNEDIEEGQIITEVPNMDDHLEKKHVSESAATTRNVNKRILCSEHASNGDKVVEEFDNQRILEALAKMEKRRERFKDPVTLKKEPDKIATTLVDLLVDAAETKQQRPARKRQWGGS